MNTHHESEDKMVGTPHSDRMSEALMPGSGVAISRADIPSLINPKYGEETFLVGKTIKGDWVLLRGSLEDLSSIRQVRLCDADLRLKLNMAESLGLIQLQPGGPNCSIAVAAE